LSIIFVFFRIAYVKKLWLHNMDEHFHLRVIEILKWHQQKCQNAKTSENKNWGISKVYSTEAYASHTEYPWMFQTKQHRQSTEISVTNFYQT